MDAHEDTPRIQILSVSDISRRRRWTDDEKVRIVGESHRDGVTIADVARRHEISRSMLYGFVESFNGRMRDEFLNETLFRNLAHARDLIAAWATDYNTERPHLARGYQTPAGFALHLNTAIARPAARDESSARRAIAQPAPKGVNQLPAPVAAG